jgi:hypothetical protein
MSSNKAHQPPGDQTDAPAAPEKDQERAVSRPGDQTDTPAAPEQSQQEREARRQERVARQEAVTTQIATALSETAEQPLRQITQIVRRCGEEKALAWLEEAQAIEQEGGMLTRDESRRRTLGGVYFQVVRKHLRNARHWITLEKIFGPPEGSTRTPTGEWSDVWLPLVRWRERGTVIEEARAEIGEAYTVKITLVGKLGKCVERRGFTLAMMEHGGKLPPLPKGIPVPDPVPSTQYVVYIGNKQWRRMRQALMNSNDVAIIEGVPMYDKDYQAITVFATMVTTRNTQQAQRELQRNKATAQQGSKK